MEGEPEPIGVTAGHPFWSVDRQDWIAAEQLLVGERLATGAGEMATVFRWEYRGEEPVYNIEVEGDHCYRVGEQGILVHNASTPAYGPTKSITFMNGTKMVTAIVGTSASITLDSTNVGGKRSNLTKPNWWTDLEDVVGVDIELGHILASQIGGKEKGAENLTPLYAAANSPAMNTCETFLRRLVEECKYCAVEVAITVNDYGLNTHTTAAAKPVMPTSVTITWTVDAQTKGSFVIVNDPNAVTQDPCRVKNLPCR